MERVVRISPVSTYGPGLAAGVVEMVREETDYRLDYSASSLATVDRIVDGMAREGLSPPAANSLLLGLGAYTCEVLVRLAGGRWIEFDAKQRGVFGQPFGVRAPDGQVWNPLGKVVERYEENVRNSLRGFYSSVVGRSGG